MQPEDLTNVGRYENHNILRGYSSGVCTGRRGKVAMMQEPKKKKPPNLPIKHTPPPPFIDGIRGNETGHTYTFEGMKMPWHSEDKPFGWSQAAWEGWLRALDEQENRWRDYEWDEWE